MDSNFKSPRLSTVSTKELFCELVQRYRQRENVLYEPEHFIEQALALHAKPVEYILILYLDVSNREIKRDEITLDEPRSVAFSARQTLKRALEVGASSIAIAHNHPAMTSKPSLADIQGTCKLMFGCMAFGMGLVDHVIVCRDSYFSMREKGILGRIQTYLAEAQCGDIEFDMDEYANQDLPDWAKSFK